ncbi:NAD-binding protein [uncultured Paenibacillus sp.]|uniref:potassium channel family protein n=1 Tax=uncultured Paenibacillus sp. TaxID=227322 RepID=UPI0015B0846D|nr:NAD-binding protein [uncultured Paenibacillus sp.]
MKKNDCRHAIIAGCSRVGAEIASMLSSKGKDVVVLDNNKLSFRKLSPDYSGFTVEADATDVDALKQAGIEKADLLVAATNDDNTNIMIAQIASKLFQVPRVISRLYDYEKEVVYNDYNVQIIYPTRLTLHQFEQLISEHHREGSR